MFKSRIWESSAFSGSSQCWLSSWEMSAQDPTAKAGFWGSERLYFPCGCHHKLYLDTLPWFSPAESKWHWRCTASLLEGKHHAGLFWKNRCTCTYSRKSHCYKPTSETDLKENRSYSMISYSLYSTKPVFNKAERQQMTEIVAGNTLLHSTVSLAAKGTAGYWRYKTSSTALERIRHLCRCNSLVLPEQATDRSQGKLSYRGITA